MNKRMSLQKRFASIAAGTAMTLAATFNPAAAAPAAPIPAERTIYLTGSLTVADAETIITKLHKLDEEDSAKPIRFHIVSGGGSVAAAFAIYDHSRDIKAPIETVCAGEASSAAFFLLTTMGSPNMRKAYPNCRIMAHEISWGGGDEKTSGVSDKSAEQRASQNTMNGLIAKHSGWSLEAINRITERRDFYMSAQQAKQLGFIDEVIKPRKPEPAPRERDEFPRWLCRKLENPRPFCP